MRKMPKTYALLLSIFLAIAGLVRFTFIHQSAAPQSAVTTPAPESGVAPENESKNQITFAGFSGLPPKFIDSGLDKGLGWLEYHTQEVRKGLQADGFEIKQEWMTPARIAHEFEQKSPICVYPFEWNDPDRVFAQKPNRIYSIPLNVGGEYNRSIVYRAEDDPRFAKHLDPKGDLNLESLLKDRTLKTLLIRDRDYGRLSRMVTEYNATGEQQVKTEYRTHVMLLVARDNRQIVEMLNAERFDYTISDVIEDQDLKQSGIDPSRFHHLNFESSGVLNKRDPSFVFVSIACAVHPLTLRAMPYINQWISRIRGLEWYMKKSAYRRKMDPKQGFFDPVLSTILRFRGEFNIGGLDFWYPKQQAYFAELKRFPDAELSPASILAHSKVPVPTIPPISMTPSKTPRWTWLSDKAGTLTVLSEAIPQSVYEDPSITSTWRTQNPPIDLIEDVLSDLRNVLSTRAQSLFNDSRAKESFTSLDFGRPQQVRHLTLFAYGLFEKDIQHLFNSIPWNELTELIVLGANPSASKAIVERLPSTLVRLKMITCSLSQTSIEAQAGKLQHLQALHLDHSQVTERQLGKVLQSLPDGIRELSLSFLRNSWSAENCKIFGARKWPWLASLNLALNYLTDTELITLAKGMPTGLKRLNLGSNVFTPRGLALLFEREFPKLTELDLRFCKVGSTLKHKIKLPSGLTRLKLRETNLTPATLSSIVFPRGLTHLDLSENTLGDQGMAFFIPLLAERVESLILSNTKIGSHTIQQLFRSGAPTQITALDLSDNGLTDTDLEPMFQAPLGTKALNLRMNSLHDKAVARLSEVLSSSLLKLDLSYNPITAQGVKALAKALSKNSASQLKELGLFGLLSLDVEELKGSLKSGLEVLGLGDNLMTSQELAVLAPHLPVSLRTLDLRNSAFGEEGVKALARHMPPSLGAFRVDGVPLNSRAVMQLMAALPRSLSSFRVSGTQLNPEAADQLGAFLPQGLQELWLVGLSFTERAGIAPILRRLPPSLIQFRIRGIEIAEKDAVEFLGHWPSNLRQAHLEAAPIAGKGVEFLMRDLPPSVERISFFGLGMTDAALKSLEGRDFENLFMIGLSQELVTDVGLDRLLAIAKRTRGFELANLQHLTGHSWEGRDLSVFHWLFITNVPIPRKAILKLFKKLSPDVAWLNLTSIGLTLEDVGPLIRVLPKHLRRLHITGNRIGQKGIDQMRAYQAKKEAEEGIPFLLIE